MTGMPVVREFEAIGTHWVISLYDASLDISVGPLFARIQKHINEFDSRFSRFRAGTMVDRMSKAAGAYVIARGERPLIELYYELYKATEGLFTPLIGQALTDAGYDAQYSLTEIKKPSAVDPWENVIEYKDGTLEIRKPSLLDFGAAGKGFIIDQVSDIISQCGISSFCVDAGGDMIYRNGIGPAIDVGLEHPDNTKQVIGSVPLLNASICASAGNRRSWGAYHHILNPRTLTSPDHIKAVWVIAASAMLADALATCLFLVSPQALRAYKFEHLILNNDYTVTKSDQFNAKLYYNKT